MQSPVKLVYLLRPSVPIGILVAIGASMIEFSAVPFLLSYVAEHYLCHDRHCFADRRFSTGGIRGSYMGSWQISPTTQPCVCRLCAACCIVGHPVCVAAIVLCID